MISPLHKLSPLDRLSSDRGWTQQNYITALSVLTTSDTEQTITATIVGTGFDLVSFENSIDGINYTELGTSLNGTYNATTLTEVTLYYWRARLKRGSSYGGYSPVFIEPTFATILLDGNTVNLSDFTDESKITKTGTLVSSVAVLTGGNNPFVNAGADNTKPTWDADGITFDGTAQEIATGNFGYEQPELYWLIMKQITHAANQVIVAGTATTHKGTLYQATPSPGLNVYSNVTFSSNKNLPINAFGIVMVEMNAASSKLKINNEVQVQGAQLGTADYNGITLGRLPSGTDYGNFKARGGLWRKASDSDANRLKITDYLRKKFANRFIDAHIRNITSAAVDEMAAEPTALLSDDGNQIDLWYMIDNQICYSYSIDGINYSNPLPTTIPLGYIRNHVVKYNGVYYHYATEHPTATSFHLFTSTDKIHYTDQGVVLAVGAGGTWDDTILGNVFVWQESGDWKMLYEARGATFPWEIGLATATAPEGPWTKSVSNPVLTDIDQGCGNAELPRVNNEVIKHDGKYYMYFHHGTTGSNGNIRRAYSTDLVTWVDEGILWDNREIVAGRTNVDHCLVQFKGKTYMFYSVLDQVSKSYLNVAIDNRTLAELLALTP